MSRILPLAVLAALVGALWMLPRPEGIRLAATQAGTMLRVPAQPIPASEDEPAGPEVATAAPLAPASLDDGEVRPLWRHLTEGSAAHATESGGVEVWVRGYRMDLAQTSYADHRLHARLFESIKRSLRSIAAEEGVQLSFKENSKKGFPGVLFWCTPHGGELALEAHLPDGSAVRSVRQWYAPGHLSLIPFLVVILVAVLLRRPFVALAAGAVVGAVLERVLAGGGWLEALGLGTGRLASRYLGGQLADPTRLEIVFFIVAMLAMVGVITRAGGVRGLMHALTNLARNARRSQAVTFFMGLVVFFDHYANAALVGSTMRPLTDRFKVAREKLAYIVDSTAAPVAGLSMFSTWIAFEVSTFSVQLPDVGLAASQGYEVFLRTLPFRFYSLLTLFLVALVVLSGRDLGPMRRAEMRARRGEVLRAGSRLSTFVGESDLDPAPAVRQRARTAILPLVTMIVTTLTAVLVRGRVLENGLLQGLFQGIGTLPLMAGALAGFAMALLQAWSCGLRAGIPSAAWAGVRSALMPLGLLLCAWTIGAICYDMGTTAYLSVLLQETINPLLLPILLFVLSSFIAFATGSSWSTMTILLPLVVSLGYEAGVSTTMGGEGMLVIAIASVLEGAIFGDHCSPISHTTVMSSIAASCDHVDHVKTQAPYAILAMVMATVCGYYPAVLFELSPLLSLALGASVLVVLMFFYGKKVGAQEVRSVSQEEPDESEWSAAA